MIPPKAKEFDDRGNEIKTFKDSTGKSVKFLRPSSAAPIQARSMSQTPTQKDLKKTMDLKRGKWHKQVPYLVKLQEEIELK